MKASLGTLRKWCSIVSCAVVCYAFLFTPQRSIAAGVVTTPTQENLLQALEGGGTVTFDCDGTIVLTNTIVIGTNTVLNGNGHLISLSGSNAVRLFNVDSNASLTLLHLTITDGRSTNGGGIYNEGTLSVSHCVFSNNVARGQIEGAGGAIFNVGTVLVTNSTLTANRAEGAATTLMRGKDGYGGAIYNGGGVAAEGCTFRSNSTSGGYGGSYRGHSGGGGDAKGGAIYNVGAYQSVNCTYVENATVGGGGGGTFGPGGSGWGGAIYNANGNASLTNCTVARNVANGGTWVNAMGAGPGYGYGGGIANYTGQVALASSIIADCTTVRPGGQYLNEIVLPTVLTNNAWGSILDHGHNISSDGSCNFTNISSFNSTDPLLGPLADNGGPTSTILPLPGSPAIDGAQSPASTITDQRGFLRGDIPDIGSTEVTSEPGRIVVSSERYFAGETNTIIRLWRTMGYSGSLSIQLQTSDETAIDGHDYVSTNTPVVFEHNEGFKDFVISIIDDGDIEPDETILISLFSTNAANLGQPREATLTITNDDFSGIVSFTTSSITVSETDTNAVITVVRENGSRPGVSVNYATGYPGNDSAVAGSDYIATSGTLHFGEGETNKVINIPIINDEFKESSERFGLFLSNAWGATLGSSFLFVHVADDDHYDNIVTNCDHVSLETALKAGGLVKFSLNGTVPLTNTIDITTNVILDATGHQITISGGNFNRIFNVASNGSLTLLNLTLADGRVVGSTNAPDGFGGAIDNTGSLTIGNCVISNNAAFAGPIEHAPLLPVPRAGGGAIHSTGNMIISNTAFFTNSASGAAFTRGQSDAFGGALLVSAGTTWLSNVAFDSNQARGGSVSACFYSPPLGLPPRGGHAHGGAISAVGGALVCESVTFTNNVALGGGVNNISCKYPSVLLGSGYGGAIFVTNTTATIDFGVFSSNASHGNLGISHYYPFLKSGKAAGGGIFNVGSLQLADCSFMSNSISGTDCKGGAIYNGGKLQANQVELLANFGHASNGGIGTLNCFNYCFSANPGGAGSTSLGAGIFNDGEAYLRGCSIMNNVAAGGSGGAGGSRSFTYTIHEFDGGDGGKGGSGLGGGVYNLGVLQLNDTVVNSNLAVAGPGGLGGLPVGSSFDGDSGIAAGAGVWNGGSLTLSNTVVAVNTVIGQKSAGAAGVHSTNLAEFEASVICSNVVTMQATLKTNDFAIGSYVQFSVVGLDVPETGYGWFSSGTNEFYGATTRTLIDENLDANDATTYSVNFVHDTGGTATLNAQVPPTILSHSQGAELAALTNVKLLVTAHGLPLHYQWYADGTPLPGATTKQYAISVLPENMRTYTVVVSNSLATATSSPIVLTMAPTAPLVAVAPANTTIAAGSPTTIRAVIVATEPSVYQWRFNGADILGATTSSYTIPKVTLANNGVYSLVVSNDLGYVVTSNITVTAISRGDLSGDGHTDILLQHTNGTVARWAMNGTNFIGTLVLFQRPLNSVGFGDFNHDHQLEYLWRWKTGTLQVQSGLTNINLSGDTTYGIGTNWAYVGANDVNGDGNFDVVWQNKSGQLAATLFTNKTFFRSVLLRNGQSAGLGWKAVGTGDFNNDLKTDLVFHHTTGKLAVWFMDGTNFISAGLIRNGLASAPGWQVVGLNDLNDDAESDILWQNSKGQIAIWFMNQTNFVSSALLRNGQPLAPGWRIIGVR